MLTITARFLCDSRIHLLHELPALTRTSHPMLLNSLWWPKFPLTCGIIIKIINRTLELEAKWNPLKLEVILVWWLGFPRVPMEDCLCLSWCSVAFYPHVLYASELVSCESANDACSASGSCLEMLWYSWASLNRMGRGRLAPGAETFCI